MEYLSQFLIILAFSAAGELLSALLPLPIPASIYGLVLLFAALCTGLVRYKKVEKAGGFLVSLLPILFVAPAVNLLDCWDSVKGSLLPITLILIVSTVVVFAVSGKVTQWLLDRKGEDDNG